ncbi:MAG: cobyric acid synthase [Thermodesulfobacteriota bacterium]
MASQNVGSSDFIDFSLAVNPLGPPESLRRIVSRGVETLCRPPEAIDGALISALADSLGIAPERLAIGCGVEELLVAIARSAGRPRAIIPLPGPALSAGTCRRAGLETHCLSFVAEPDLRPDLARLGRSLRGDEIVFVSQPNDPSGRAMPRGELLGLVGACPATLFVIDETWADFVAGYRSLAGLSAANLLIVRSLSHFYAIPGLPLGCCSAAPEIIARLGELLLPGAVSPLAVVAVTAFLDDHAYIEESRAALSRLRDDLAAELGRLAGLTVYPGEANFLLVRLDQQKMSVDQLAERLAAAGIAISGSGIDCTGLPDNGRSFFRLAVRGEADNERLVAALAKVLGRPRPKPPRRTPALMLQGTASNAGKSVLTAALCRILLQDGLRVAPFKAQNMSLNSHVTRDGLEMGRAQVVQAQAARLDPDVRMNPVLLKPSSDVGSQVIVNGKPVANMTIGQYVAYKPQAWQAVCAAYDGLAHEYDAMILEGAGSPGEVNLKHHDIVNMRMAAYARSPVLLVGDIDRGGVFASFVGIMEVLAEWERELVAGFIVNRFRGTESLLDDAFAYTLAHTGRPVLGVVPYLPKLGLPEEDSVSFKAGLYEKKGPASDDQVEMALIDLPHISNFTDVEPFLLEPDVHLHVVRSLADLERVADRLAALLLPGSKNVMTDLDHLVHSGLADLIRRLAAAGRMEIVGICGGFQMLGSHIDDPHGLESEGKAIAGLGLLNLTTTLEADKTLTRRSAVHGESGLAVHGYEIHHGRSRTVLPAVLAGVAGERICASSENGLIWGSYLHGIFDADPFRRWFIDRLRTRRGLAPQGRVLASYDLEPAFDRLAAIVRARLDMNAIYRLLGL